MARSSRGGTGSRIISPGAVRRGSPVQFFQETIAELRKCVWPTREETVRFSIYVIILAAVSAVVLAGADRVLRETFTRYILS